MKIQGIPLPEEAEGFFEERSQEEEPLLNERSRLAPEDLQNAEEDTLSTDSLERQPEPLIRDSEEAPDSELEEAIKEAVPVDPETGEDTLRQESEPARDTIQTETESAGDTIQGSKESLRSPNPAKAGPANDLKPADKTPAKEFAPAKKADENKNGGEETEDGKKMATWALIQGLNTRQVGGDTGSKILHVFSEKGFYPVRYSIENTKRLGATHSGKTFQTTAVLDSLFQPEAVFAVTSHKKAPSNSMLVSLNSIRTREGQI